LVEPRLRDAEIYRGCHACALRIKLLLMYAIEIYGVVLAELKRFARKGKLLARNL